MLIQGQGSNCLLIGNFSQAPVSTDNSCASLKYDYTRGYLRQGECS